MGTLATPRKAAAAWRMKAPAKGGSYCEPSPALISVMTSGRPAAAACAAAAMMPSSHAVRVTAAPW